MAEKHIKQGMYTKEDYLKALIKQPKFEKDHLDFAQPFNLYGHYINIGLSERVNVLERETVKIFQKKLGEYSGLENQTEEQEEQQRKVLEMMEQDKLRLENIVSKQLDAMK